MAILIVDNFVKIVDNYPFFAHWKITFVDNFVDNFYNVFNLVTKYQNDQVITFDD